METLVCDPTLMKFFEIYGGVDLQRKEKEQGETEKYLQFLGEG